MVDTQRRGCAKRLVGNQVFTVIYANDTDCLSFKEHQSGLQNIYWGKKLLTFWTELIACKLPCSKLYCIKLLIHRGTVLWVKNSWIIIKSLIQGKICWWWDKQLNAWPFCVCLFSIILGGGYLNELNQSDIVNLWVKKKTLPNT